jgi:hypothetical protein
MVNSNVEAATDLKVKGNKAFAGHDWLGAVDFYTKAIEKNDQDPSFYCNRAQVGERSSGGKANKFTKFRRRISSLRLMAMRWQTLPKR